MQSKSKPERKKKKLRKMVLLYRSPRLLKFITTTKFHLNFVYAAKLALKCFRILIKVIDLQRSSIN